MYAAEMRRSEIPEADEKGDGVLKRRQRRGRALWFGSKRSDSHGSFRDLTGKR